MFYWSGIYTADKLSCHHELNIINTSWQHFCGAHIAFVRGQLGGWFVLFMAIGDVLAVRPNDEHAPNAVSPEIPFTTAGALVCLAPVVAKFHR